MFRKLLIFTSILIVPLSLAELFGFMPSCILSGVLFGTGFIGGLLFPKLSLLIDSSITTQRRAKFIDIIFLLCLGIFFGLFSLFILIFQKGEIKNGKVVFDIGHGSRELPKSVNNFNIDTYKIYGHRNLVNLLEYYNFETDFIKNMTLNSLNDKDILVTIMPSKPYSSEEIKSIKEFVLNGGGF